MRGQTLSHYEILGEISRGGMGIVYRARDVKLNRDVALKVLPPDLVSDHERKRRFVQEAQAAAALKHPNIAVVYEIDEDDGMTFIAMELVEGDQLSDVLNRGALPTERALEIATDVARGLACAHESGIVHRDLKPANVVLSRDGAPKIIDFGLAKLIERADGSDHSAGPDSEMPTAVKAETEPGRVLGTVAYMSPEQARGQNLDTRSDVFSYGVVLHELLTGTKPFDGPSAPELLSAIIKEPHETLASGVGEPHRQELQCVIDRCLAKSPDDRFQQISDVVGALEAVRAKASTPPPMRRSRRLVAVAALLAGLAGLWLVLGETSEVRRARDTGLPELQRLVDEDHYVDAFALASRLDEVIAGDPLLDELWLKLAQSISVSTEPAGANIYYRSYAQPDADWEPLGASPLESRRIPLGPFWLKLENPGFRTLENLFRGSVPVYDSPTDISSIELTLDGMDAIPEGMVRVPGGPLGADLSNLEHVEPIVAPSYVIDKHEVTNEEFKKFVDEGGYDTGELWRYEFRDGDTNLSWQESTNRLRDRTGRPGPSTWEVGTYPEGQAKYPVSGVSWFEAAAFCEFVGKRLPTVYEWSGATNTSMADVVIPLSNFGEEGPRAVGSRLPGPGGTYDMAGNVREWCWNEAAGRRYILGGAINQPTYMFYEADAAFPMDRSPMNGFRCVDSLGAGEIAALMDPIDPIAPSQDLEPASDEVFAAYKAVFAFDPVPLQAKVVSVDESSPLWTREKITFRAAYENEEVVVYLYLPAGRNAPFQSVVYFPGSSAERQSSPDQLQVRMVDFLVQSGRAVAYPIYKGTHERKEALPDDIASRAYMDFVTYWMSDLTRTIDYLETREDIDTNKLGYYGFSWGAFLGPIALAVDERFSAAVLLDGGFGTAERRPEVTSLHYAPRVDNPVLMINGSEDMNFPLEQGQKPLFDLLGTPPENKDHILYPAGHAVFTRFRNQAIGNILDWFDRYLGPVSSETS